MFCLTVVKGTEKGKRYDIASFPFVIGNNQTAELTLSEPGIWPDHIVLELEDGKGPCVSRLGEGSLSINSEPAESAPLRNGDLLSIGGALLRFGIARPKRKSLVFQNAASWVAIAVVALCELVLIFLLKTSATF